MYSMLDIFILDNLHSYLIEFYTVKWKTLLQPSKVFPWPSNTGCPFRDSLFLWGLSLAFLGITGTLPWKQELWALISLTVEGTETSFHS